MQRHTWGVMGSLVIVLLHIFSSFWQWNNFENMSIFGKAKAHKVVCHFWATLYMYSGINCILDKFLNSASQSAIRDYSIRTRTMLRILGCWQLNKTNFYSLNFTFNRLFVTAETCLSRGQQLWFMTLTCERYLDSVGINQRAKQRGQKHIVRRSLFEYTGTQTDGDA